jgi:hypothetical protein
MNEMMVQIDLMAMFQPHGGDNSQSLSSPGQEGEADWSFLECLLGAFNGVEHLLENGEALRGRKRFSMFAPAAGGDQQGAPLLDQSVNEHSQNLIQKVGTEEMFKAKPTNMSEIKAEQPDGTAIEKSTQGDSEAPSGIWRIKETSTTIKAGGIIIERSTQGDPGPATDIWKSEGPIKTIEAGGKIVEGPVNVDSDPGTAGWKAEGSADKENNLLTSSKLPDRTAGVKNTERIERPGEIPRIFKEGSSRPSETSTQTDPESPLKVSSETLPQAYQNPVRRAYMSYAHFQMVSKNQEIQLGDYHAPEIRQNRGTQESLISHDDVASSPLSPPSAAGESGIMGARPHSISLTEGVMQQILENLNVKTWKVGQKDLRIQLHPEEMGRVRMEIGLKDHQIVLKIHVENPLVKDLIENSVAQLRENLNDQGLKMDRCSVTVSDQFHHSSGRNDDHLPETKDVPFSVDGCETQEATAQGSNPSYHWDSDLVNLFI